MIVEALFGFGGWIIELIFSGFNIITLPLNLTSALFDIMKFGAWIIGGDLFAIVFGNIFFWLGFKFVSGLILFIYRLIPLT